MKALVVIMLLMSLYGCKGGEFSLKDTVMSWPINVISIHMILIAYNHLPFTKVLRS